MKRHPNWTLILVLAATLALTFFRVPLASSQGLTLVAPYVEQDLPIGDPDSPLWQQSTALSIPLSAQNVTLPKILETSVRTVSARALHDGSRIALLVEWSDATKNDTTVRAEDFRDAVAVQFPLAEGPPFFCMGQVGGNVNIWHWKADWEAERTARADVDSVYPNMYVDQYPFTSADDPVSASPADYTDPNYLPAMASGNLLAAATRASSVEDLVAGGFGTLTAEPLAGQNVDGFGEWSGEAWRVIFSRGLRSAETDDVRFTAGRLYSMAFAAWDGANGERNGEKSTSQWVSLQLAPGPAAARAPAEQAAERGWLNEGFYWVAGPVIATLLLVPLLIGALVLALRIYQEK
jgi:hypothetical protein